MSQVKVQAGIEQIELYEAGKATLSGRSNIVKLSSNENPSGPSERAIDAFQKTAFSLHRYPSADHETLREAIGRIHGIDPAQIICGVGSDEVLSFLCQAYAGPGDEVIHTEHGFALYRICALAAGAHPVEVKERERVTDVDAILEACNEKTAIIFIANPNNPTGTMISDAEVRRLADHIPPRCLLVLDGAYVEYVEGFDGGKSLVEERNNVVMTRTFSKIYGLGGMRVGWGYAPKPIIDNLNRIRGPFNLSAAALAAAEAAVQDQPYIAKSREENARLRSWLAEALLEQGISSDTSATNFILARFSSETEANACDAWLREDGIIVRKVGGYNLPTCLRISIGTESECRQVAHSVKRFKEAQT